MTSVFVRGVHHWSAGNGWKNVTWTSWVPGKIEQQLGPIDSFITALHCLEEYCGYGELHDEMIRDGLVVSLRM